MNILQVNTCDTEGGAAKIAWNLFQGYRSMGHDSWLAVGEKKSDNSHVIPAFDQRMKRLQRGIKKPPGSIFSKISDWTRLTGYLRSQAGRYTGRMKPRGREDFDFPMTWHILNLVSSSPHIIHLHNLHGSYFDLRALPWLSRQVPVVLTLHDAWLLGGHCAHSFDCERWKTGCGNCPDLNIPLVVEKDDTASNWLRKKRIFEKTTIYVATPCHWLMGRVKESILGRAAIESKVIPNGIDLSVFTPVDRSQARRELNLPQDKRIVMAMTKGDAQSPWQDYTAMESAILDAAEALPERSLHFVLVGKKGPSVKKGPVQFDYVPYQKEAESLALYYQASDLYIHSAKADTFPTTILEALACGTPVAATQVGGIPEQVKGLRTEVSGVSKQAFQYGKDVATGMIVKQGDVTALATAVAYLMRKPSLLRQLGENAADDARKRFGLDRQVKSYLRWYMEILGNKN